MSKLRAVPVELVEANEFVLNFHRHNRPVAGHRFSIGVTDGERLWGVCIVGRPISRLIQAGSCSFLYGAAWRAWRAMGGDRLITYTLQEEGGASLRGAGWTVVAERAANNPAGWKNRPGRQWQAVVGQAKFLWEVRP
jgi:hypothetical protein